MDKLSLDNEVLQQAIEDAALKGAKKAIEEYYCGWNSPYYKAITAQLEQTKLSGSLQLPDIIGLINDKLSAEIDQIANTAVAKTFIPLVSKFLVREKKEMNFSEILKTFVKATESTYDDAWIGAEKHERFDWITVKIGNAEHQYQFTLHKSYSKDKEYSIVSLPTVDLDYTAKMTVKLDGAKIEMPFCRDVLKDEFVAYIGRLILACTEITLDTLEFDEDMFYSEDECRCH